MPQSCWSSSVMYQIREELLYHNIVLYPFDSDENDDEELKLNKRIRVNLFFWSLYLSFLITIDRIWFLSLLLGRSAMSSLTENLSVVARTDGASSILRTKNTVNLFIWGTSWLGSPLIPSHTLTMTDCIFHLPGRTCRIWSKPLPRSITKHSDRSSFWLSRRTPRTLLNFDLAVKSFGRAGFLYPISDH